VDALGEVAQELYGLAPEDFTAARNARAKSAQADGDRELAESIKSLAKPTAGAWLANQLVRQDRDALEPLLELGSALREASARLNGPEMRSLSREQPKVVAGLVKRATEIGREAGKAVSASTARDLEDTLRAAVADADAAEQLMSGCLANGLEHNGFGLVGAGNLSLVKAAPADRPGKRPSRSSSGQPGRDKPGRGKPGRDKPGRDERRAEQLAEAERDVEDAQAAVDVTADGRDQAAAKVEEAEAAVEQAHTELDDLRERMEQAKFALSRAEGELRQAKQRLEQSARAARAAANALGDAEAKRDRLKA
jgi:hypothetical protein